MFEARECCRQRQLPQVQGEEFADFPGWGRYHFVRAKVEVREYGDGSMAIYHGKRRVGSYDSEG